MLNRQAPMSALRVMIILFFAILSWLAVVWLIVDYDVGSVTAFAQWDRAVAYALFIFAPLITFMPIARALQIPLYDLEAVVGWSTLLYVLTFINPGETPALPVLLLFLISLMMSLATIFTLVSYAIGYRLLTRRSQQYDFLRARREGYLVSMFIVGCLLLHVLNVLTIINGTLLLLIVLLLEIFLLSRGNDSSAAARTPDTVRHTAAH
jgi:hypothetical protein